MHRNNNMRLETVERMGIIGYMCSGWVGVDDSVVCDDDVQERIGIIAMQTSSHSKWQSLIIAVRGTTCPLILLFTAHHSLSTENTSIQPPNNIHWTFNHHPVTHNFNFMKLPPRDSCDRISSFSSTLLLMIWYDNPMQASRTEPPAHKKVTQIVGIQMRPSSKYGEMFAGISYLSPHFHSFTHSLNWTIEWRWRATHCGWCEGWGGSGNEWRVNGKRWSYLELLKWRN